MGWVMGWIVLTTIVLVFNRGAHKDKDKMDKICADKFGTKL